MSKFKYTLEGPEPVERRVRLALKADDRGVMDVVSLNAEGGVEFYIVGFTPEGTLRRYSAVSSDVCDVDDDDDDVIKLDDSY